MFNHVNDRSGLKSPLIADDVFDIIMQVKKACVRLSIQFVSWCDIFVSCSSLTCAFLLFLQNAARLDSEIIYDRDFEYDFFGFKTLERSYLLKVQGKVVERPQHMLMRVAVGIHKDDIDSVIQTYHLMSQRWFTHASPTLFNAGTPRPQVNTCRLIFCYIYIRGYTFKSAFADLLLNIIDLAVKQLLSGVHER